MLGFRWSNTPASLLLSYAAEKGGHLDIAIAAEKMIDGRGNVTATPVVVISAGRITDIANRTDFSPDADTALIELDGTLLPGFIEMHAHLMWNGSRERRDDLTSEDMAVQAVASMRMALASGVTTLRDLGGPTAVMVAARRAQQEGTVVGPRLVVSGSPITTTGGHMNQFGIEADTAEEVAAAVSRQAAAGVDWIKIASSGGGTPGTDARVPQYTTEVLRAAVEAADRHGLKVAAHCHVTEAIRSCVDAGVHSLEHCSWLSADSDEMWDVDDTVIDNIVAKGIYVDPTHALIHLNQLRGREGPPIGTMSDPAGRYGILAHMWHQGAQFVTGIDSGISNVLHSDFAWTPRLMVEAIGMPPMDAITSATRISAECLGLDAEIGTIEVGKVADLVVVDGDPLADIAALHEVRLVVADGRVAVQDGIVVEP